MVFAKARERRALEAFALDAQHVYHVEFGQNRVEVRRFHRRPKISGAAGISVGGATTVTWAPMILRARGYERAADARMADVAHDADASGRRCVRNARQMVYRSSSACVGCWCLPSPASTTLAGCIGNYARCARMLVANDDHVDLVRVERFHRIDAGSRPSRSSWRSRQNSGCRKKGASLCQLKRRTRARGRLVEHVHDREAL